MDKVHYINHHYLACLIAFLLILIPAHASYSVDAWRRRSARPATVPSWSVWVIRFQVGVPYFFAGVAKLNFDWLIRGEPMRLWMSQRTDFPIIGTFFTEELVVRGMVIGSTLLDLTVPFLLLHRRTRTAAFALTLVFHFMNSRLFGLGTFPWMMIVATTIFFEPDWPRRMGQAIRRGSLLGRAAIAVGFALGFLAGAFVPPTFATVRAVVGGFGVAVLAFHLIPERFLSRARETVPTAPNEGQRRPAEAFVLGPRLAWFLAIWALIQLLLPVRHFAIPGNTHWTEEGNRFAWHLFLKHSEVAMAVRVTDIASGEVLVDDIHRHLTPEQLSRTKTPDMILQLAHFIEDHHRERGHDDVIVEFAVRKTMNLRPPQLLIDHTVDLSGVGRPYIPPADWVTPLEPYRTERR